MTGEDEEATAEDKEANADGAVKQRELQQEGKRLSDNLRRSGGAEG